MSTPEFDTVAWFEVASDDPDGVQRFYGDLFGWTFAKDEAAESNGMDYRVITYRGAEAPTGGVFPTGGATPNHAIFSVLVQDTKQTCTRVESLGGKVVYSQESKGDAPAFAYLLDTSGNLFGVFTPPAS